MSLPEPSEVATAMITKVSELKACRAELLELAKRKAETLVDYRKAKARYTVILRLGEPVTLEDKVVVDPPVTLIPSIVQGICWKEKLEAAKSEAMYKAKIVCMDALKSELNGLQSINRFLEDLPG